jgi:hypothetical protein
MYDRSAVAALGGGDFREAQARSLWKGCDTSTRQN